MARNTKHRSKHVVELYRLLQSFATFFDAFLPLLSLELFFPPLWNVHSSLVRVRRLVSTTIGAMVFIDENNIINQKKYWLRYLRVLSCHRSHSCVTAT